MFLKMLFDMIAASFIWAFFNVFIGFITIAAIGWAILVLQRDSSSRIKQNEIFEKTNEIKIKELNYKISEQNNRLMDKRIKLLDELEGLIALPIRNSYPNGFGLRWVTKPTINFAQKQLLTKNPQNNSMYQTIYGELKFHIIVKVKALFPTAIDEYNDFLDLAVKDLKNPQQGASQQTIDAYDKFQTKCENILMNC
jgi:hypothetical protein